MNKQRVCDLRTLGFEPQPTPEQIETAFKALVLLHHPDKGGDAATFQAVSEARERLLAAGAARCETCRGSGRVMRIAGFHAIKTLCPVCGGAGHA